MGNQLLLVGSIPLDDIRFAESSAQTLLFGPGGRLFVPISDINQNGDENTTVNGSETGSVRRYNVETRTFDVFVPPNAQGGALRSPWYLTFGKTDPGTLVYDERHDSCGVAAPVASATITATLAAPTASATPTSTPIPGTPTSTLPPSICAGDCRGTSSVAISDLVTLVNIALGTAQSSACPHGVAQGVTVDIALIIHAVNNALSGSCGGS
jgi:hypothetical protein